MRLSSLPSRHRLGAALLGAIVIGAAMAPAAALADETSISTRDDPSDDARMRHGTDERAEGEQRRRNGKQDEDEQGEDEQGEDDQDRDDGERDHAPSVEDPDEPDDPDAADGADGADPGVVGCSDPLSVISWDGAEDAGDPHAVAVTAQLLDAATDGWSSASWEAAAGTTLTAVAATHVDGGVTALEPGSTGTALDVVALTFCGTTEPVDAAPPEPADDPPPAPVTVAACDDLLAIATAARVEGDELAVAITAQALESDEPGWSNVGWAPAAGTTLRTVFVTGTDGTVTEAGEATSATDVASLTFCGTVERATPGVPLTSPPTTSASPVAPTASASDAPAVTPRPLAQERPTDAPETDLPVVTVTTPEAPGTGAVGTDTDGTDTEEVEVLGTQLTRQDRPSGSGPVGTGVALLAVLALLATAGGVLWSRHS